MKIFETKIQKGAFLLVEDAKMMLMAIAICFVFTSCGSDNNGNGKNQQQSANDDVALSRYTKAEDYTPDALVKMKSLGKTEKDKISVVVGGNSDWTIYNVYIFENGECIDKSDYTFCVTKISKELFDAAKLLANEVNETDLWIHHTYGSDTGDWQSWYDAAKRTESLGGNKVLE